MGTHGRARITGTQKTAALVGGAIGGIAALSLRPAIGSPRTVWHWLGCADILPPLWVLSLLFVAWLVLIGGAVGFLLSCSGFGHTSPALEATLWRGCTCLCLSIMLTFGWYTLLFGKGSLLISFALLLAAAVLAVLCALSWRTFSLPALIMGGYALWILCLSVWQLAVIFHN